MSRAALLTAVFVGVVAASAGAQTFTPQSVTGLTVTFTTERAGGSRVIFFGEVRNTTNAPAEHVTLLAEGLDEGGKVISRGRGYVAGLVPSRGSAPFEIRMLAAGRERRFRVTIESFQFFSAGGN